MDRCTQPGCAGTVEGGYCVVCGMAPAAPPDIAAPAPPANSPAPGRGCNHPGCNGTLDGGYCTTCGLAPIPPATPAAAPAPVTHAQASGPVSRGSLSLGSTPSSRSVRTGSTRTSGRGMLGVGLVEVPRVPYRDPATAVMSNPEVAENRRFCSGCGEPVGRTRGDRPGRTEGFCPKCGARFSFTPKLRPGDLVGGQYEVLGCIAHGGLGWIYLGRDRNVSDRWVVLKGLLDSGDADALAAAAAERAFLAEVEHPNIVKIYNFVQHEGSGYIVMEYVGGRPLKDILKQRRKEAGPEAALPLPQVIAYGLEVLRALGYLHSVGVLYCDFKPDNAIQSEEQIKLIDLGGVYRMGDTDGAIYGTVGYQAPEIPTAGPSIGSDLYTVGRTLAVLSFPFKGFTSTYADSLPARESVPLLTHHESYDRLLRTACHTDPAQRFQDASEMAEQLTGVLREVLSAEDGQPRPAPSTLFGPDRFTPASEIIELVTAKGGAAGPVLGLLTPAQAADALPIPLVDGADPAAGFLAGLTAMDPEQLLSALESAPGRSPEVTFTRARVQIELGSIDVARRLLDQIESELPGDWRIGWYRATAALAAADLGTAEGFFDGLYSLMPGEAAPKLALAYCRELRGDLDGASRLYDTVWRTDRGHVSAGFGLARTRLAAGDRNTAVQVLDSIPQISSHHLAAQAAAVATAVRERPPAELTEPDLVGAGARLERLRLDAERNARLAAEVLHAALDRLPIAGPSRARVLGAALEEKSLRGSLEETYRTLARLADDRSDRLMLVNRANSVRPRTLF